MPSVQEILARAEERDMLPALDKHRAALLLLIIIAESVDGAAQLDREELCARMSVSKATLKRAIAILRDAGVIDTRLIRLTEGWYETLFILQGSED